MSATSGAPVGVRSAAGTWSIEPSPLSVVNGVASTVDDTWLLASSSTFRRVGAGWQSTPRPSRIHDVCGVAPADARGVGNVVMRWDGAAWSAVPGVVPSLPLTRAFCLAPDDVWLGGSSGLLSAEATELVHFDGVGLSTWGAPRP